MLDSVQSCKCFLSCNCYWPLTRRLLQLYANKRWRISLKLNNLHRILHNENPITMNSSRCFLFRSSAKELDADEKRDHSSWLTHRFTKEGFVSWNVLGISILAIHAKRKLNFSEETAGNASGNGLKMKRRKRESSLLVGVALRNEFESPFTE